MKKLSFIVVLFALSIILVARESTEVSLTTATGEIKGTLLIPETVNKPTVVLIIAGSGPTDRNGNNPMMTNNSLKMLAEGLAENGIASLRYDKRGVAQSMSAGTKEIDLRFEDYVNDAKAWVGLLDKDARFEDIVILGHSEGSLIGMLAAQKAAVKKFVSLAGVGAPAAEIIRKQLKAQPPVVLQQTEPILSKLEKGEAVDSVPPMLFSLFRPSVQPYMISWFKYDPAKELAQLEKPILIIQGTTDIQVGLEDAEKLYKANDNAQKEIIEGMNHVLKKAEADRMKNIQTYSDPNLALHPQLIPIIVSFVTN